jgi:hypothetical protein
MKKSHNKENPSGVSYDAQGNAKKDEMKKLTQEELNKGDLPDIPIYFQGWIKYFKYQDEVNAQKPKYFFKNSDFEKQSEVKTDSDKVNLINYRMVYYQFQMRSIFSQFCIRII